MAGALFTPPEELRRLAARRTWAIDPNGGGDGAAEPPTASAAPLVSRRLASLGIGDDSAELAQATSPLENSMAIAPEGTGDDAAKFLLVADKPKRKIPEFPARNVQERAEAIYGETSGLYPQSIDPTGSPNNPRNWETDSADNLAAARRYVGIVAGRNRDTHRYQPQAPTRLDAEVWDNAVATATQAHRDPNAFPREIEHFYIRWEGDPKIPFRGQPKVLTIGPFRNVGNPKDNKPGDNNTFIEFYGPRPKK